MLKRSIHFYGNFDHMALGQWRFLFIHFVEQKDERQIFKKKMREKHLLYARKKRFIDKIKGPMSLKIVF